MASNILARMAVIIDGQTAQFNKAMAQSQGQLASLTGSVKGLGAALGVSFGAAAIVAGLKQVISLAAEFEHTMSTLKGITGATGKEFDSLRNDALRLGAATKFTANEVGQLQIAFGRLGFNTKEILDATEATLALAAATGEDLAKSADVAGSTVRGFGLEARETQRVVDVMAKSFNTTALGLDNFAESMKYVAPIAKSANVSVEETTALLGVLADAGIRGSSAGTALRKIFGDLSKDGRPVQERLAELGKKGITLSDAFDEVGRTAQTALLVLTENTDKSNRLAESFKNVTGEAEAMARVMQDDLLGDADKLSSAFEGLFLQLTKTGALRDLTQALTGIVAALSGSSGDILTGLDQLARGVKEGVDETNGGFQFLIDKLKEVRRETGKPIDTRIAQELGDKYKLTEDQANVLYRAILDINKALSFQEKAIQQFNDFAKRNGYTDLNLALDDYKQSLYELILAEQIRGENLKKSNINGALDADIKKSGQQVAAYQRVIGILNEYAGTFPKTEKVVQQEIAATVKNLDYYQESLKKVNEAFEALALTQEASGKFTDRTLSGLRVLAAEGAGLEEFIKRVNRLKDSFRNIDLTIKPPDVTGLLNPIKEIVTNVGGIKFDLANFDAATGRFRELSEAIGGTNFTTFSNATDEVTRRFEEGLAKMAVSAKIHTDSIKGSFIDLGGLIGGALSGIGEAIGNSIAGVGNFGQDILKVVAGFAKQLGEILISTGVAMLAAKKLITNPLTAIAAGIALVAIASAASAAISKSHGSSVGGGGATASRSATENTSSINASATEAQDVKVTGKIVARGQDLWVILNNFEQNNKFTKANG
jgi:hypothetical protein